MAYIQERTDSKGNKRFRAQIRMKGAPSLSATFTRKTDAKRWIQQEETRIREGRHFSSIEAKRHTVSELIKRYKETILPLKPKSQVKQTAQLNWWNEKIGYLVLSDLTPAKISEAKDILATEKNKRGDTRGPATVKRYLAVLSHACSIAVKEWGWLDMNPVKNVSKPKEPRGRVRYLEDKERISLLKACKHSKCSPLYLIVVLAISTGMRKGEILNLSWPQIDISSGRIILTETKNGERRTVYVTGHALEVLKEYSKVRRLDTELVFPSLRYKGKNAVSIDIRKPWAEALKQAKIEDFRFHDLRHSTASYLAMNGASLAEIAEILGHKTLQMVRRYAHLSESHTSSVVESMNKKIF